MAVPGQCGGELCDNWPQATEKPEQSGNAVDKLVFCRCVVDKRCCYLKCHIAESVIEVTCCWIQQ